MEPLEVEPNRQMEIFDGPEGSSHFWPELSNPPRYKKSFLKFLPLQKRASPATILSPPDGLSPSELRAKSSSPHLNGSVGYSVIATTMVCLRGLDLTAC